MAAATSDKMQPRPRRYSVDDVSLLVRVLAGNPATSAAILTCLNAANACRLRQLHPAVGAVVVGVPWADKVTPVVDVVRWRAALPAAVGMKLSNRTPSRRLEPPALAALAGITAMIMHLDLQYCRFVSDELLLLLPPLLRTLNLFSCTSLTARASIAHLTGLTVLDCRGTMVGSREVAGLPPSLQELVSDPPPAGASLAHLTYLRVLYAGRLDAVTLASLPRSLLELHVAHCRGLPPGTSFAHLPVLHTLNVSRAGIDDASLASMPPSLVSLTAHDCGNITSAAVLPPLPSLRVLDVSRTGVGDALVASLPAGLAELRLVDCRGVTAGATLDHVAALQALHSFGADLAPGVLAGCRARGCAVPAAGVLRGHRRKVTSLALLADGRLASGDAAGEVRMRSLAVCESNSLDFGSEVGALATLQDGHRLAVGVADGSVETWDMGEVPPLRTNRFYYHGNSSVRTLAVLHDGRLAVGYEGGDVRIFDMDGGKLVATLRRQWSNVVVLAALLDGALACGWDDCMVQVWNVDTREYVATLAGHSGWVRALAVLPDGRLASGAMDGTVRLWDVSTRTCGCILSGHTRDVSALAALPDGRLVSGSWDGTVRLWDTRPAAAAAGSHAAGMPPMVAFAHGLDAPYALVPLPDGRLASADGDFGGAVHLLHVPPPAVYE